MGNITLTPIYEHNKEVTGVVSNVTYNSEYQKSRGHNLGVDITPEMVRAKDLKPIQSKQEYELAAKMALAKHHGTADGQAISHCLDMTLQASVLQYKTEYNEYILGKGASNPAISYPEHDRLKKIKDATKKQNYEKEARKEMEWNIYHKDSPEFLRANNAAEIANDRIYQKQRNEVIAKYRGYQTMDSRDHPEVTRAKKANDLISSIKYRKDYEDSREVLCFPYTLTDVYDKIKDMQKLKYDYILDHENTKAQNKYNMAESQLYAKMKEHHKMSSDLAYKEAYENNKGKMLGTDVTPEMSLAKDMKPIQNKQSYEGAAKAALAINHVAADGHHISHCLDMTVQASALQYKADYNDEVLGKGASDPTISYPEHQRLKKINNATKKQNYEKDAKERMEKNIYTSDAPEFVRATKAAEIANDRMYQKQRNEVIANYRGYQTMDSRDHPEVIRGKKANALISTIKYKKDYEDSREVLCFPYTLTDVYDKTKDMQKLKYGYVLDYENTKSQNKYNMAESQLYAKMKEHYKISSDLAYKDAYESNKGKMLGTDVTPEMTLAKDMKPVQSKQAYQEAAKAALAKHHVAADGQEISHCIDMTMQASTIQYKAVYNEEVLGRSTTNPAISYPEHQRLKKISETTKKQNYEKEARKEMEWNIYHKDSPEFLRANNAAEIANDRVYQKQRNE